MTARPSRAIAGRDHSVPRYGYRTADDTLRQPPTAAERMRWKQMEVNKFEHMARLHPADRALYELAAARVREEILAIETALQGGRH